MNEIIKVNYDNEQLTVSGRELHEFLGVKTPYTQWFERMVEYGFNEGIDFVSFSQKSEKPIGGRPKQDHELTIPMAKELCMIQRNEKGKQARQYFLKIEELWNSPEMVMQRALKMSQTKIQQLMGDITHLQEENMIMQPKADYYDCLVENEHLTNFRETAKELGVQQKQLMTYLRDNKYIYKSKRGNILPYANKNKGYFETKDFWNPDKGVTGTQTLVTVKGKNKLRAEMRG